MCLSLDEHGLVDHLATSMTCSARHVMERSEVTDDIWVCRELVRMLGGSTDWDGLPDEIHAEDPIRVF